MPLTCNNRLIVLYKVGMIYAMKLKTSGIGFIWFLQVMLPKAIAIVMAPTDTTMYVFISDGGRN